MAKTLTLRLHITGVRETIRAFGGLPKDANDELRDKAQELSEDLARKVTNAGRADTAQSALIAPTVKAKRDRVPVIQAGGTKRVGSNRKPAYKVLFGSEFGSNQLKQFRPHVGQDSYWFFKTVEDSSPEIGQAWNEAADDIIRKWARG